MHQLITILADIDFVTHPFLSGGTLTLIEFQSTMVYFTIFANPSTYGSMAIRRIYPLQMAINNRVTATFGRDFNFISFINVLREDVGIYEVVIFHRVGLISKRLVLTVQSKFNKL